MRELDLKAVAHDSSLEVRIGRHTFSLKKQPLSKKMDPFSRLYHSSGDLVLVLLQTKSSTG